MASQLAAKERRLQQLQRAVADLQSRLVAALKRNALACALPSSCWFRSTLFRFGVPPLLTR
jgi:hypothetical protein